jgi:hypothetical protein
VVVRACHERRAGELFTLTYFRSTDQPATEMWTLSSNETCRPTANPSDPCTLGFSPVYVVLAKTQAHVKAGLDFARDNNLRFIVRNTGHDFLGRSTGWGSFVVNTHALQGYKFIDWKGPGTYKGPAVELAAGTQGGQFLKIAHAQNPPQQVVTGECAVS